MSDYARAVRKRVGRNVRRLRGTLKEIVIQGKVFRGKVTQGKLAEAVGYSEKQIGRIERGDTVPLDVIADLANKLSVDVIELFISSPEDEAASEEPSSYPVPREALRSFERALGLVLRAKYTARRRGSADRD
jgi:transcriptional regulator with XRE-family HTH domain